MTGTKVSVPFDIVCRSRLTDTAQYLITFSFFCSVCLRLSRIFLSYVLVLGSTFLAAYFILIFRVLYDLSIKYLSRYSLVPRRECKMFRYIDADVYSAAGGGALQGANYAV